MNNGLGNLDDLFQSAQDDGLTDDTMDLVIANLNGPAVMTAVHTPLDQLATNEVTLAMNIIDMSGSMASHAKDLIRAYNEDYLEALRNSTAADDILVSTILFDDKVETLHGYLPLEDVPELNNKNYKPDYTTALYDAIAAGITNMVLYAQQLRSSGVMVRGIIMAYTDGADNASKQTAKDIQKSAEDLLKQEIYSLALVGFGLQKQMGFKDPNGRSPAQIMAENIGFPVGFDASLNATGLKHIFHLASQSAMQMSQTGAAFGVFSQ